MSRSFGIYAFVVLFMNDMQINYEHEQIVYPMILCFTMMYVFRSFVFSLRQLDQEINRLERLLELPAHAYTRMTDELMFLLRESRVDKTPMHTRRRRLEEMQL